MLVRDAPEQAHGGAIAGQHSVLPLVIFLMTVGSAIPLGAVGSSAGPHVLGLLLLGAWLLAGGRGPGYLLWVFAFAAGLLTLHSVVAVAFSPCRDLLAKSVLSLLMLCAVLFACTQVAAVDRLERLAQTLVGVAVFVTASVALDKVHLLLSGASDLIRPSGIFLEPSHLALAIAPVLAALIAARSAWERLLGWICALLTFLLSGSATLFVVLAACLAATLASSRVGVGRLLVRMGLGTLALLSLIWLSPFRDAFVERIAGVVSFGADSNLSSVVYVHGWQLAQANVEATLGLGLGVNRMGCEPRPVTVAGEILDYFDLGDGNYNDGSFTFAKALSEFGVLAPALWVFMFVRLWKAVRRSQASEGERFHQHRVYLISAALVAVFGSLVRGTGYFAGTFLLGVIALMMLAREDIWR